MKKKDITDFLAVYFTLASGTSLLYFIIMQIICTVKQYDTATLPLYIVGCAVLFAISAVTLRIKDSKTHQISH